MNGKQVQEYQSEVAYVLIIRLSCCVVHSRYFQISHTMYQCVSECVVRPIQSVIAARPWLHSRRAVEYLVSHLHSRIKKTRDLFSSFRLSALSPILRQTRFDNVVHKELFRAFIVHCPFSDDDCVFSAASEERETDTWPSLRNTDSLLKSFESSSALDLLTFRLFKSFVPLFHRLVSGLSVTSYVATVQIPCTVGLTI